MIVAALIALSLQDPLEAELARIEELLAAQQASQYFRGRQALIELGADAIPWVLERLQSPDSTGQVKFLLCDALGEIRQNRTDVSEMLLGMLNDEDEFGLSVASVAARALGLIGARQAIPALVEVLGDEARVDDTALLWESITALGRLRAVEAAASIRTFLDSEAETPLRARLQVAAIEALGKLQDREAIDRLGELLEVETMDSWTRAHVQDHAALALERITGESKGDPFNPVEEQRLNALNGWRAWLDAEHRAPRTRELMNRIAAAIDAWRAAHNNENPPTLAALTEGENPALAEVPHDAWDHEFVYRLEGIGGATYDLVSFGRGGEAGGRDGERDLWSHDEWKDEYIRRTQETILAVSAAIERFIEDVGHPPAQLDHLLNNPGPELAPHWDGIYYAEPARDAWNRALNYRLLNPNVEGGLRYEVFCLGEDGVEDPGVEPVNATITSRPAGPPVPPEHPEGEEPPHDHDETPEGEGQPEGDGGR